MALFYLTGVFYHIAKRITGVQYVSNNLIFFLLTGNLTLWNLVYFYYLTSAPWPPKKNIAWQYNVTSLA